MKIGIDTKKGVEVVSDFLQKTSDISKKAIADVQAGAVALSEKSKQDNYMRKIKRYNPVFPEVYFSEQFKVPNMIIIVDDAIRRGIDVCEGSIGWLDHKGKMEVFYLYDEAVPICKLQFIPSASCDAIYFVDSFDRSKFIRIDCIFSKAHEERLAELKHIAHSLGAKKCSIEISEYSSEKTVSKKNAKIHAKADIELDATSDEHMGVQASESANVQDEVSVNKNDNRSGTVYIQFEGSDTPKKPKLKWFAHDDNIKRLIEMRCKGINMVKHETLEISGASSATMSRATACSIDEALSVMKIAEKKNKGGATLEKQVVRENHSKLIFEIEF